MLTDKWPTTIHQANASIIPTTVAFIDIDQFVPEAAKMPLDEIGEQLRTMYNLAYLSATRFDGNLLHTAGDGLLLVFWEGNQKYACLQACIQLLLAVEAYQLEPLINAQRLRVGVAAGDLVWSIWGPSRLAVNGPAVNLASRLQHRAANGCILFTSDVFHSLPNSEAGKANHKGIMTLHGIETPIDCWEYRPCNAFVPNRSQL
jgi:class 3 adenylate cyclase